MTKTYRYTFTVWKRNPELDPKDPKAWYEEPVTLTKRVTDKMEERPWMKAGYAANCFSQIMREKYGKTPRQAAITAYHVEEVTI